MKQPHWYQLSVNLTNKFQVPYLKVQELLMLFCQQGKSWVAKDLVGNRTWTIDQNWAKAISYDRHKKTLKNCEELVG